MYVLINFEVNYINAFDNRVASGFEEKVFNFMWCEGNSLKYLFSVKINF